MRHLLKAARKEEPCDLLLSGGQIANLYTMEYEKADVAIKDGVIVGIGKGYEAKTEEDCTDKLIVPGFIEGHMHIESTFMVPRNLAPVLSPLGTTTIMADPHEIANTCGTEGVKFMHDESVGLSVDIFYGAPSCVPASYYETAREPLEASDLKKLFDEDICTHLGEMMNFPGVFLGDGDVWNKLEAASGRVITGHAPRLSGGELAAYIIGGCDSDHECESAEEALEKLRRGMWLMVRQGATARNLKTLAPLIRDNEFLAFRSMAVSDDITPDFIHERGHLNGCLKELMAEGISPLAALRMVTLSPAEYFRLYDRGSVAPGKKADLVLLDGLENCGVLKVWKNGEPVAENGKPLKRYTPATVNPLPGLSSGTKTPTADELKIKIPAEFTHDPKVNVIGVELGQVVTKTLTVKPTVEDGYAIADAERDLAKFAVVEKNRGTGRTALGFIHGFKMKRGAIAMSIAHDAHNYTCAGMDDESMSAALAELSRMGGGIILALDGKIICKTELPVGGLMSLLPFEELRKEIGGVYATLEKLDSREAHALMQLSFLSLSVIPELKMTDRGYFDISSGGAKPLFVKS